MHHTVTGRYWSHDYYEVFVSVCSRYVCDSPRAGINHYRVFC